MIIIFILIGTAFIGGWITLIHLVVRNEVRFEDKKIKKARIFWEDIGKTEELNE